MAESTDAAWLVGIYSCDIEKQLADGRQKSRGRERMMLKWAIIFAVIALVAGLFGFTGIAAGAAGIAKILFGIFLVLFVVMLALALFGVNAVTK